MPCIEQLKRCTRCLEDKPLAEFHKHKSGRGGLTSQCKECVKRPPAIRECRRCDATWLSDRIGRALKLCPTCDLQYKVCRICKQIRPHSDFGVSRATRLGLRTECKGCTKTPRSTTCLACGADWKVYGPGVLPKLCRQCEVLQKVCHECRCPKPHSEFNAAKGTRTGLNDKCRDCAKRWHRTRGAQLKRINHLKTKYGMTIDDWDRMYAQQGGKCACCKDEFGMLPAVDHCHKTGAVRGILCSECNTGLGFLGDSVDGLSQAETYLWTARNVLAELAEGRHTLSELAFA